MNINARKYKLNVCNLISKGIGVSGTTKNYNILNGFNYVTNTNVSCSYDTITIDELKNLNEPEYKCRISDFMDYLGIENPNSREKILTGSSFYDEGCDLDCKLNPDFIVYRFLDGVRIINVGEAKGELQYKAYPVGDNSNNYNWSTNPTIFNINLNDIYVFEVRDYYMNAEYCKVSRTISLPTLVQSTTFEITNNVIFIDEQNSGQYQDRCYSTGLISISPTLNFGQKYKFDFNVISDFGGNGCGDLKLFCTKCGTSTPVEIYDYKLPENGLTSQGTVSVSDGDVISYEMNSCAPSFGDCSETEFKLSSVNGLNTINSSIDLGQCSVSTVVNKPRENVDIFVRRLNTGTNAASGLICVDPLTPTNEYVDIDLCANAVSCLGGSSNVEFYCQPNGATTSIQLFNNSHNNSQPYLTTIRINRGDAITYELNSIANNNGSCATSEFNITDAIGSNGVIPTIRPSGGSYYCGSGDSYTNEINQRDVTVSMCNQTDNETISERDVSGYINVDPNLIGNECVSICYCGTLLETTGDADACIRIYCQPSTSTSSTIIVNESISVPHNDPITCFIDGTITYRPGDTLCYRLYARGEDFSGGVPSTDLVVGRSILCLNNVTGYNGVNATINTNKCCDGATKGGELSNNNRLVL